jgi:hypothetical protein
VNILRYEIISEIELLTRLKKTPLRGFDNVEVYKDATLSLERAIDPEILMPPQRYVLTQGIRVVEDLADSFETLGIDIFGLTGALLFWPEGSDPEKDNPIPFLPPMVEESYEPDRIVKLVNDGMHRVYIARKRSRTINIVYATNVPREYPYYAYAMLEGWGAVREFDELPDEFQKKDYRNPDNYKALFRQFNKVFPGIQEQRKQSNPAHIKV